MPKIIKKILNIVLPIMLGAGILWWMYRDFDFNRIAHTLRYGMNWWWMIFSLVFGVTAQLFRGLRWKQTLAPIGEHPRTSNCVHAIFLSYAASLVIPRIGEVTRCGVLNRYDGTSFPKAIGTVVTERIIDSLLILFIAAAVMLSQIGVFAKFFRKTGTNLDDILRGFTATGYIVTAICLLVTIVFLYFLLRRFSIKGRLNEIFKEVKEGVLSLRKVENKWLFAAYTLGIWMSYFLHFYITFFCFPFTEQLGLGVALVSFIVGSIAVIVPTPNGLGPWHFAVKTIFLLYGVEAANAETFVLIVHTIQTALIPILGILSMIVLAGRTAKAKA